MKILKRKFVMTNFENEKDRLSLRKLSLILADRLNLPSATAYDCTKTIFMIMTDCLHKSETISINNFGTFSVKQTKERRIYIPSEGNYRIKKPVNKVNFKSRINF